MEVITEFKDTYYVQDGLGIYYIMFAVMVIAIIASIYYFSRRKKIKK